MNEVTIRIWHGCVVRQVLTVSDTGTSVTGAVGGAGNSTHADIELDPWAVVDHRVEYPTPTSIRYEESEPTGEMEDWEPWEADDIPQAFVDFMDRTSTNGLPVRDRLEKLFQMYESYRKSNG